jgi:small GTP-binding protein
MVSRKIALIGDFSTGKTSLIRRFVDNEFSDKYLSTIGVKISKKIIELDDIDVQGLIWDIEGGTPTKPLNQTYLRGLHGCIIASDITRIETINSLENYINIIKSISEDVPYIVVLNKYDKIDEEKAQKIYQELLEHLKLDDNMLYCTSAKSGLNVENVFNSLANSMVQRV